MSKIDSHFEASIQHREPSLALYDDLEWWDEAGGWVGGSLQREDIYIYIYILMAGFVSLYDRNRCNIVKHPPIKIKNFLMNDDYFYILIWNTLWDILTSEEKSRWGSCIVHYCLPSHGKYEYISTVITKLKIMYICKNVQSGRNKKPSWILLKYIVL